MMAAIGHRGDKALGWTGMDQRYSRSGVDAIGKGAAAGAFRNPWASAGAAGHSRLHRTGTAAALRRCDPDRDGPIFEAHPTARAAQHDPDAVRREARL